MVGTDELLWNFFNFFWISLQSLVATSENHLCLLWIYIETNKNHDRKRESKQKRHCFWIVQKTLFEIDSIVNSTITIDIIELLNTFEPRIRVQEVLPKTEMGFLDIEIRYNYFFNGTIISDSTNISTNINLT